MLSRTTWVNDECKAILDDMIFAETLGTIKSWSAKITSFFLKISSFKFTGLREKVIWANSSQKTKNLRRSVQILVATFSAIARIKSRSFLKILIVPTAIDKYQQRGTSLTLRQSYQGFKIRSSPWKVFRQRPDILANCITENIFCRVFVSFSRTDWMCWRRRLAGKEKAQKEKRWWFEEGKEETYWISLKSWNLSICLTHLGKEGRTWARTCLLPRR